MEHFDLTAKLGVEWQHTPFLGEMEFGQFINFSLLYIIFTGLWFMSCLKSSTHIWGHNEAVPWLQRYEKDICLKQLDKGGKKEVE